MVMLHNVITYILLTDSIDPFCAGSDKVSYYMEGPILERIEGSLWLTAAKELSPSNLQGIANSSQNPRDLGKRSFHSGTPDTILAMTDSFVADGPAQPFMDS